MTYNINTIFDIKTWKIKHGYNCFDSYYRDYTWVYNAFKVFEWFE
jgi:hypothetical protein